MEKNRRRFDNLGRVRFLPAVLTIEEEESMDLKDFGDGGSGGSGFSDSDEKIRELFKQKHAKDWNPIVVELPYFGNDEKSRKVIENLTRIFAECGYEVANVLALKLDTDLVRDALDLAARVDEFRKSSREVFQAQLGDPQNLLLEDIFRAEKKEG